MLSIITTITIIMADLIAINKINLQSSGLSHFDFKGPLILSNFISAFHECNIPFQYDIASIKRNYMSQISHTLYKMFPIPHFIYLKAESKKDYLSASFYITPTILFLKKTR